MLFRIEIDHERKCVEFSDRKEIPCVYESFCNDAGDAGDAGEAGRKWGY